MSFKTTLIKKAVKWTPKKLVKWVANFKLKGIAEVSDFYLDLDERIAYGQVMLYGEAEPIEVKLEGFAITVDAETYYLTLQQATSNRPWLDNIFTHIIGKSWKIPAIPKLAAPLALLSDLLKPLPASEAEDITEA